MTNTKFQALTTCKVVPKAKLVCKELLFLAQTSCYICSLCGSLLHARTNHNHLCIVYYLDLKIRHLPCGLLVRVRLLC